MTQHASEAQQNPHAALHWNPPQGHILAFCDVHLEQFASTNPGVTFCLEGTMSTLTIPSYTIYKHVDVDY